MVEYEDNLNKCWSCGMLLSQCNCGSDRVVLVRRNPVVVLPYCGDDIWNPDGSARIHTCLTRTGAEKLIFGDRSIKKERSIL